MVIGITGRYCSGKNTVTELLEPHGFDIIDVDRIGHKALLEKREIVGRTFGSRVLKTDSTVDRRTLGRIVFRSRRQRRKLEKILHPCMISMVKQEMNEREGRSIIINAAILFRMGLHTLCDSIIFVQAPLISRLRRARSRDTLSFLETVKRLLFQGRVNLKKGDVDIHVIRNRKSKSKLKERVDEFVRHSLKE